MEAVNSSLRPKCIYDYKPNTGELYWTTLLTGVQASLQIPTSFALSVVGLKCLEEAYSSLEVLQSKR
jgi:hypothetical protein